MTQQKLKIVITIKSIILIAIIGGFVFSNHKFSKVKSKESRAEKSLKSEVYNYQSKIDSFNAKTKDISEALKRWDDLTSDDSSFNGIKISVAKNILDRLKEKYEFKDFDIKMSKPTLLEDEYKREVIGTEASTIKMGIRSYSDIDVMSFIYELSNSFPGYFKVNSYFIKLEREIDEILVPLSNEEVVSSVYTEIECDWRELKELK